MDEDRGTPAMGNVVRIDEERIRDHLGKIVRGTVEDTLNALLDAEAGYAQVWCTGSGSGVLLGVLKGLAVAELDALDELTEAAGTVEPTPMALG